MNKPEEERNLAIRMSSIERTMRLHLFLLLVSLSCSLAALVIALVFLITSS